MTIKTLSDLVFHVREVSAGRPTLLSVRLRERREGLSTTDFVRNVHSLALALEQQGLSKGDRVAIFSENRPEWHVVDFACHLLGAPTVPLYPTLPRQQVAFVLRNSGCRWVFYSDARKRDLLQELTAQLTAPPQAIAFDGTAAMPGGLSITRLMGEGAARRGAVPIERFRGRVEAEDLASLVYTSGTTGDPKGVMLRHRQLIASCLSCAARFNLGAEDRVISFLPLSHIFQRMVDYCCFYRGTAIHYLPSVEQLPRALLEIEPTVFAAPPRFYVRACHRAMAELGRAGRGKRWLARWALGVGRRYVAARHGGIVGPWLALERRLASSLVFKRIKRRFGGHLRLAVCGGATLPGEIENLFQAIGLPIFQAYGLSETSAVVTANAPGQSRRGSVGRPLEGVELRVAEEGEILVKGPGVMVGYWENPQATAEAFTADGWLRTGDLGELDAKGFLFLTGRKKELLITTGGENISPQLIEQQLVGSGWIAQAVVVGDQKPYVAALLVPDFEQFQVELGSLTPEDLVEHKAVVDRLAATVEKVNEQLAAHEKIRRFMILPRELTVENGEVTPTFKPRRGLIVERYAEEIATLFPKSEK